MTIWIVNLFFMTALAVAGDRPAHSYIDLSYYQPPDSATELLIQSIVTQFLPRTWTPSPHPRLYLTAGPIAAGKSGAIEAMIRQRFIPEQTLLVDPDAIKMKIPEFQRLKSLNDPKAGDTVHRLSMYIADRITEEALHLGFNTVYMTSLRYTPGAINMVQWIRRWYPDYQIQIVSVRSPFRFLNDRNVARFQRSGRLVPIEIIEASTREVDRSVRALEPLVDGVITIANDQNRNPVITHVSVARPAMRILPVHISLAADQPAAEAFPLSQIPSERMLISLDLDWTAYYPKNPRTHLDQWPQDDVIHLDGAYTEIDYRMTDGLKAFVKLLYNLQIPLMVQSGGERARNEDLLRATDTGSIGNLFERSFRILSAEDLATEWVDGKLKLKKDLQLASGIYHVEDMGHVDDRADYLMDDEQNLSTIFLGPTYTFIEDYDAWASTGPFHLKYDPPDREAWALERNKLAFVVGVILNAREMMRSGRARHFRDAIVQILRGPDGEFVSPHAPELRYLYFSGAKALTEVDETWQKVPLPENPPGDACLALVKTPSAPK